MIIGGVQAQKNTSASGGEGVGEEGTVSYSVGQVSYSKAIGVNGSVAEGVQQPYEIFVITGVAEMSIDLLLSVYPNPTTDYLTLKVEDNVGLRYQLYDIAGRVLEDKKVSSTISSIDVASLPEAIYFINVEKNSQIVKTFKIIKN